MTFKPPPKLLEGVGFSHARFSGGQTKKSEPPSIEIARSRANDNDQGIP